MARINVAGLAESDGLIFKPRPAGEYPATISAVELTETGESSQHPGSPMLKLQVKLQETEEYDETKLFNCIVLPNPDYMDAEQCRKKVAELKRICLATGLDCEDDAFDTDDLYQRDFLAVVTTETPKDGPFAGKEQNRLSDCLPL
jgi:hypothetical protein